MRRAMRSRFWSSVSGMKFSMVSQLHFPNRAALDAFFVLGALENGVNKDARRMNLVRIELAEFNEFLDFGNDVVGGSRHHGIEVARGLAIGEIAPAVTFPRFDEREITAQAAFEDVHAAIEFASFFSLGDHRAIARGRVERGNTGTSGTQAFAQRALRIEFDLQFTAQDQLLEEFILSNVGGDHLLDLALLEQHANPEIVDAGVVADDGEVFRAFPADGSDEVFRDAAEAETTHKDGRSVVDLLYGSVGGGDTFVHSMLRSVRRSLLHPVLEQEAVRGVFRPLEMRTLSGGCWSW